LFNVIILLHISFVRPDDILDGGPADRTLAVASGHEVLAAHEAHTHVAALVQHRVGVVLQANQAVGVIDRRALHSRGCHCRCGTFSCERENKVP